jgi:adenylate cyclase
MLAFISRRVSKPIALLARATQEVAAGRYDKVVLAVETDQKDEVGVLSRSFQNMVEGLKEREKIRGVLNKVVSKDIADEILQGNIHLGGEERISTVLFVDIRGFTKMTEHLAPHEVIALLNEFMTKMSLFIDKEGGVIDKYIGDAIMALYGAPIQQEDSAWRAIKTAIGMTQSMQEWNVERAKLGLQPIASGVGIHTGPVVAGNMGAESRLNYTVVGANVNLAARLCDMAKPMQILTTDATLDANAIRSKVNFQEEPFVEVKGFSEKIRTYAILGLKDPPLT